MNYRTHYGSDALITRRLDYSKRLLSVNQFNKSAAGVLTKTRRTPITRFFKVFTLVACTPNFITQMPVVYEPGGPRRSSGSSLLAVPQSRTNTSGGSASSHCAPSCWNSLPEDPRGAGNIHPF